MLDPIESYDPFGWIPDLSETISLRAQHAYWIVGCGPASWDVTSQQCYAGQQTSGQGVGYRIGRRDSIKLRLYRAGQAVRRRESEDPARSYQHQHFAHHHP